MNPTSRLRAVLRDDAGYTLLMTLLIAMALGVMTTGALMMLGHSGMINEVARLQYDLESAAESGVEEWRARINSDPTLYPATGYRALEEERPFVTATGETVPGIVRTVFAGPTGDPSGQYGVFGSVVSIAEAEGGALRVIRRGEIRQESFARFAYFTDSEGAGIGFGGGDQIAGPVHSNDRITIYDSRATFRDRVTTARTFNGARYARFLGGSEEGAAPIPMPTTADLDRLRGYALQGGTAIQGGTAGGSGAASVRIEFLAIDVDGDGIEADEGFFRVYRAPNNTAGAQWVSADVPGWGIAWSRNCGDYHNGVFWSTWAHSTNAPGAPNDNPQASLVGNQTRCFPGGSTDLTNGVFQENDGQGAWQPSGLAWPANTPNALRSRPDFDYLYPLSRRYNPNFKGVIHVNGKVAVSGVVRGRVTLAATDEIVIIDDLTYATGVGAGPCGDDRDLVGLFSGGDIVVAHNTINSPINPINGNSLFSHDDTDDEHIQSVLLALGSFTVENFGGGPDRGERCGSTNWGRGCLAVDGGIIQRTRGAVGTSGGTGYLKRYAYDECAGRNPPPYFPTTGHFILNRVHDVDPTGFDVAEYFAEITSG